MAMALNQGHCNKDHVGAGHSIHEIAMNIRVDLRRIFTRITLLSLSKGTPYEKKESF